MNKKDLKDYDHCRGCGTVMRESALHILVKPFTSSAGSYISEQRVCNSCLSKLKGEWKECPICDVKYFEEEKEKK